MVSGPTGSKYEWRLLDADDRREIAHGAADSWEEALRAMERACGWDRRVDALPPRSRRQRTVGIVRAPGTTRWIVVGPP